MDNTNSRESLLSENRNNFLTREEDRVEQMNYIKKYTLDVNRKEQKYLKKPELSSNKICTSKYNYINAIPKILCEQFSKVGNIYFLFLAVLQMIPSISQSGGSPVMLLPLLFVVLVNGIKDFCEDYKRKQSDSRENGNKCYLINNFENENVGESVKWEQIKPGNIVRIDKGEYFPCDLILLYSSNKNGVAYVETKNLDGETNLKYKESIKNTFRLLKNFEKIEEKDEVARRIHGRILCEWPNANMYEFEGVYNYKYKSKTKLTNNIRIDNNPNLDENNLIRIESGFQNQNNNSNVILSDDSKIDLFERRITRVEIEEERINPISHSINVDYNNFLLRGSSLRNTDYIYGIVVYTGHSTKIMLNSLNARSKQSKVFKIMNMQLKYVIIFEILICLLFSILYSCNPDPYDEIFYNREDDFLKIVSGFIYSFLAWLLTMSNIVPISLLVTIEMIKFCQAIFISWDHTMYDKENRRTAIVQSSALNEELGQIRDIFTDKTGTLTKNVMQFKYMAIGEELYGSDNHINQDELKSRNISNVDFNDSKLFDHMSETHPNSESINNFIFCLALCHSIIVEKKGDENVYNASSPDELALVNAAKYFGVEFTERTDDNYIIIRYKGNIFKYMLLHIFEFNSNRKRMSVVVRDENDPNKKKIKLICKGADSVISKRLDIYQNHSIEKKINHYLEEFGRKGLRTLMVAEREISETEYKLFKKEYYKCLTTLDNRATKIERCQETLEQNLTLLGASAIEDCLQDDLKPTLTAFKQIGIKVWMLTGDHPFTAVSIAYSCGLIERSDQVVMATMSKYEEINKKLIEIIDAEEEKNNVCMVITGDALNMIQKPTSQGLKNLFEIAINKAKCVICSRVSPKQKAELIMIVKRGDPHRTTLAIGDGANDVNMITAADVGIGIMGNEGQQAARASDYVIGQFSFLRRLMFVHGREAYRKNSFAVGYILWKNFMFVMPCMFLGIFSFFSGQTLYDPILDTLYNILFTAYPIGWFATYDKEINYDLLESNPKLYQIGMHNKRFNIYVFWRWYIYAATAGFLIYFMNTTVLSWIINEHYKMMDLWTVGISMYSCIVLVVNLRIMIETNTHNCFSIFLLFFSISSYIGVLLSSSYFPSNQTAGQWNYIIHSKIYLLSNVLIVAACILFEYGWRSVKMFIESILLKNILKSEIKKKKSTIVPSDIIIAGNKDFEVKVNSSINDLDMLSNFSSDKEKESVKIRKSANISRDLDESALFNRHRRYTGFAYAEDVANIDILNHKILDNFFDLKFNK